MQGGLEFLKSAWMNTKWVGLLLWLVSLATFTQPGCSDTDLIFCINMTQNRFFRTAWTEKKSDLFTVVCHPISAIQYVAMWHESEFLWLSSQCKLTMEDNNSSDYVQWKDEEPVVYSIFWKSIRAKLQETCWNEYSWCVQGRRFR